MQVLARIVVGISAHLALSSAAAQGSLTATCTFDRAMKLDQQEGKSMPPARINQSMRIENSKTTATTLALDGSRRATNSRGWSALDRNGWETFESRYIGDFGDVLTLEHQLGANRAALRGTFRASLITPGVASTVVQLGQCALE